MISSNLLGRGTWTCVWCTRPCCLLWAAAVLAYAEVGLCKTRLPRHGDAKHLCAKPAGCVCAHAYQHWRWQAGGIFGLAGNWDDGLMKTSHTTSFGDHLRSVNAHFSSHLWLSLVTENTNWRRTNIKYEASKSWEAFSDDCVFLTFCPQ